MKILFLLKDRSYNTDNAKSYGLSNSAQQVIDYLQKHGHECKLVSVIDANSIDKEMYNYKPDTVILEALWVMPEKLITKPSGRKGRIDILVKSDETLVAIAEIKSSDLDAMTSTAVRRNVRRQTRQVWDYIESQLELGKDVSPGIIFTKRPKDYDRMNLIEQLFEDEGIQVVWEDESIAERKARS